MDKNHSHGRLAHTLKFKLMLLLAVLVIPLIVILYLNNYYSVKLADEQMSSYTTRILENYTTQLDTKMANVSEYLLRMCLSDAESLNVSDRNDRYFYRQELHGELQKVIGFYDVVDGIFVYQSAYDEFAQYTRPTLDYGYTSEIGQYMQGHLDDILAKNAETWNTININNRDYFVYTLKADDTYLGAWVSAEEIIGQIESLQMGALISVQFMSDGRPVIQSACGANGGVQDKVRGAAPVEVDGKHSYDVSAHMASGALDIVVALETVPVYQLLSNFQWVIMAASAVIVILLLGSALIYKKYIFTPMRGVETAIAQVEQGNWDYRIEGKSTSAEFDHINENFNAMSSEIHNLKIDIYEEEIQRQQVELEYLHYQIKPHFFLNVINTISSMAQIRETSLIQKMTQYLSAYIRYTFRRERSMVTIKEELENVKNYLGMQLLRFPDSLECEMDMETRAMDVEIPAMTMMTFVENIIKHAFDMYECTKITLRAVIEDDCVHIVIKDSGKGFDAEAIEHIMQCEEIGEGGKQVGIVNIKKRLRLIYGDAARIIASNEDGAKIEIVLPVRSSVETEVHNEHTNRG